MPNEPVSTSDKNIPANLRSSRKTTSSSRPLSPKPNYENLFKHKSLACSIRLHKKNKYQYFRQ